MLAHLRENYRSLLINKKNTFRNSYSVSTHAYQSDNLLGLEKKTITKLIFLLGYGYCVFMFTCMLCLFGILNIKKIKIYLTKKRKRKL